MKAMELARRIGNIDDELVRQGERRPESDAGGGRRNGIRRILSVAVVAALMVCSFALGGLRYERRAGDDRNRRCGDYADSS